MKAAGCTDYRENHRCAAGRHVEKVAIAVTGVVEVRLGVYGCFLSHFVGEWIAIGHYMAWWAYFVPSKEREL